MIMSLHPWLRFALSILILWRGSFQGRLLRSRAHFALFQGMRSRRCSATYNPGAWDLTHCGYDRTKNWIRSGTLHRYRMRNSDKMQPEVPRTRSSALRFITRLMLGGIVPHRPMLQRPLL